MGKEYKKITPITVKLIREWKQYTVSYTLSTGAERSKTVGAYSEEEAITAVRSLVEYEERSLNDDDYH